MAAPFADGVSEGRIQVLGIDGHVLVVGPEDRIIVRVPVDTTIEIARGVKRVLEESFPNRVVVVVGVDIIVERSTSSS